MNHELTKQAVAQRVTFTKRNQAQLRDQCMGQASALVNVLVLNALGQLTRPSPDGEAPIPTEMSPGQIKSAEIILSRVIPTMKQVEVVNDADNTVRTSSTINAQIADLLAKNPSLIEAAIRNNPELVTKTLDTRPESPVQPPVETERGV